jgi:hypothetical protein
MCSMGGGSVLVFTSDKLYFVELLGETAVSCWVLSLITQSGASTGTGRQSRIWVQKLVLFRDKVLAILAPKFLNLCFLLLCLIKYASPPFH